MKHVKWIAAALMATGVLIWPETALNAARSAMRTWVESVAPALFPFMVLMPLLTCREASDAYERLFGWLMRPLFRLPGAAAPALLVGMTAGSPAGALAASRLANRIGRREAERIVVCACGLSPAFLIAGVGTSMLGSAADGKLLFITQIFTQISLLMLTRGLRGGKAAVVAAGPQGGAIYLAVGNILAVCGYMMTFQVIAAVCARALRVRWAETALLMLLDLPSGAGAVASIPLPRDLRMTLLAAMTGFGGLCIGAQNLSACRNLGVKSYFYVAMRLSAAALSAGFMRLFLGFSSWKMRAPEKILPESTLIAIFLSVPAVILCATSLFLNKRKFTEELVKNGEKHNM